MYKTIFLSIAHTSNTDVDLRVFNSILIQGTSMGRSVWLALPYALWARPVGLGPPSPTGLIPIRGRMGGPADAD